MPGETQLLERGGGWYGGTFDDLGCRVLAFLIFFEQIMLYANVTDEVVRWRSKLGVSPANLLN